MKYAPFFEIAATRPRREGSEHTAFNSGFERAIFGDKVGFHTFWTVEQHFLEQYSQRSNPEALFRSMTASPKNPLQTIELMGNYVIPECR